jgi:hypothetical protein
MEAFRTEAETAFRRRAAGYFALVFRPSRGGDAAPAKIWADLDGSAAAAGPDLRVAILDEASRRDPRLGRELLEWRASAAATDPVEETACRLGRLAGVAAHVLEAGAAAARDRGAFDSSLMGCRDVQERLAGLVSLADLARLGACRLCRLVERGDVERAGREAALLRSGAAALAAEVRAAALSLLGEDWVTANFPPDDLPSGPERTQP